MTNGAEESPSNWPKPSSTTMLRGGGIDPDTVRPAKWSEVLPGSNRKTSFSEADQPKTGETCCVRSENVRGITLRTPIMNGPRIQGITLRTPPIMKRTKDLNQSCIER